MTSECLICFDPNATLLTLPCGCKLCSQCFYNWAKSYCEDNIFANEIHVPCPFQNCRFPIPPEKVLSLLQPQNATKVSAFMLRYYIVHEKDVKTCPKCDYAGIKGDCSSYICEKCKTKWQDHDAEHASNWVEHCLHVANRKKSELMSNLVKLFIGNYCPNCGVRVDKDGGCSHVVCAKCKYEFCWYCLDGYYAYQHQSNRPCGLRVLYMMFLIGFLGLSLFAKLVSVFPSIKPLVPFVAYLFKYVPLSILELIGTFGIPGCYIVTISEVKRRGWSHSPIVWLGYICFFVFLHSIYIYLNYLLYVYEALLSVWVLIFTVGSCYFGVVLATSLVDRIIEKVKENHLDQALALMILLLCEICAALMYFINYYPRIVLLYLVDCEMLAILVVGINALKDATDIVGRYAKVGIISSLTLGMVYNAVLTYLKLFTIFRVLFYTGLVVLALVFEVMARASVMRGAGIVTATAAGLYVYYKSLV